MENKVMYAHIGKDNHIWGFYDTYDEAEEVRLNQSNPEWYCIKKVQAKDYFDLDTGKIKTTKIKS